MFLRHYELRKPKIPNIDFKISTPNGYKKHIKHIIYTRCSIIKKYSLYLYQKGYNYGFTTNVCKKETERIEANTGRLS